jgi:hypothetical protein
MTQVAASIWNQIAESQNLLSPAAKISFQLNQEQIDLQNHCWGILLEDKEVPNKVALSVMTFLPLLAEHRAINQFVSQHPQLRNALPEVLSPQEAVELAKVDYRLTPTEQESLAKILSSPECLDDWLEAAEAAERAG